MAWGHPVTGGYITSDYGPRPAPVAGGSTFHNGTDFGGRNTDWKVRSVGDGKVFATGFNVIRGWWVAVRHNDGSTTTYQHLVRPDVSQDQAVKAGTTLGIMGATGVAAGTHLHLEAFTSGKFNLSGTAWASTGYTSDPEPFMLARGVNLADPNAVPVKTPEYRDDEETEDDMTHDEVVAACRSALVNLFQEAGAESTGSGTAVAQAVRKIVQPETNRAIKSTELVGGDVKWLKQRIGGTTDGPTLTQQLIDIKKAVGA